MKKKFDPCKILLFYLIISISTLFSCSRVQTKTPIQWCILDILHNEEYQEADVIGWTSERIECNTKNENYYKFYSFWVTVICEDENGNVRIDYWICYAVIKQRCVHNAIDIFRDKYSENAQICRDCILTDCAIFKQEKMF